MFGKFVYNTLHFVNGKFSTTVFLESFIDSCTHTVFKRRNNQ